MSLFEPPSQQIHLHEQRGKSPLADRMRPETLEEFVGFDRARPPSAAKVGALSGAADR